MCFQNKFLALLVLKMPGQAICSPQDCPLDIFIRFQPSVNVTLQDVKFAHQVIGRAEQPELYKTKPIPHCALLLWVCLGQHGGYSSAQVVGSSDCYACTLATRLQQPRDRCTTFYVCMYAEYSASF